MFRYVTLGTYRGAAKDSDIAVWGDGQKSRLQDHHGSSVCTPIILLRRVTVASGNPVSFFLLNNSPQPTGKRLMYIRRPGRPSAVFRLHISRPDTQSALGRSPVKHPGNRRRSLLAAADLPVRWKMVAADFRTAQNSRPLVESFRDVHGNGNKKAQLSLGKTRL